MGGCKLGVTKLPLSDQEENGRLWGKGGGGVVGNERRWSLCLHGGIDINNDELSKTI